MASDDSISPRTSNELEDTHPPQEAKAINPLRLANERFRDEARSLLAQSQTIDFSPHLGPLRPDHSYELTIPSRVRDVQRGGVNIHLTLTWDDGLTWLVRVKLHCVVAFGLIPAEVRKLALESERETMSFLRTKGLPVSDVYGPVVATDGIEFIVIERLDGTPCARPITKSLSGDHLDRVVRQLAEFQVKLSDLKFPLIGSLYPSTSQSTVKDTCLPPLPASQSEEDVETVKVGPSVSLRFFDARPPYFLGPFTTSGERYVANIDLMLPQIAESGTSLGHPAVVYLVHLWIRDVVMSTPALWTEEAIMLRHADDRGDHIFLDKEGNLSGLIDWEWAITASKSEAFAAPMGLVDSQPFEDGSNDLSPAERILADAFRELDRPDLAECVRSGKLHQRLTKMIGGLPSLGMIRGLTDLVGGKVDVVDLSGWCEKQWERYGTNPELTRIVKRDELSWAERCEAKPNFEWL